MKYHIERNTVQETLIIPLYARKKCSELFPNLYHDDTSASVLENIDYDFSLLEEKYQGKMKTFGFLEVAMRQNDIAWEIKDYLNNHPYASVVNLGCGLDDTGRRIDNGLCKIYNIDFKDVIELRDKLLPSSEREKNLSFDLNDINWFKEIDSKNGVVFFAAGVFYYFTVEKVKTLILSMSKFFPGSKLVFDAANKKAVKLMLKTWIKKAEIKDVNAYFSVSNAEKEIGKWDNSIRVSSRGYMLGYFDLNDPSVGKFYKLLSKIGDKIMKMQIVRIDF